MAKCCQGGNECNHVITIGYLKTFVGNDVQRSSDGTVISINNNDNTYCPTYAELTSGTLIQNHSEGTTPNGDVDGIIISGDYSDDQLVNQEDLSLIYTRFKSLTISATKINGLDPCGDSSTLSYIHKYTRYTKSMTSDCATVDDPFDAVTLTSTDVNDTANDELSWSIAETSYGSISFPTYKINKNGDGTAITQSRYDDITASVTFRGTTNSTDKIRITQLGLGGYWEFDHYDSSVEYVKLTCTPTTFDCDGGNYSVTGDYIRNNWIVYHWKDSCNEEHYEITSSSTPTQESLTENVANGTAPIVGCDSLTQDYIHTENFTWHGLTASWTQMCSMCSDCDSVTLSISSMLWDYDKYGQMTESSATYSIDSSSVTILGVTCTGTNASDFTVTHDSGNKTIVVSPNSENSTMTERTASVVLTYATASIDNCKRIIELRQGVQSCSCDSVTVSPTSYVWDWDDDSSSLKDVTIESAICISNININSLRYFNAVIGEGKVVVSPKQQNINTYDYIGTLNINYTFGNPVSSCTKTVSLTQKNQGCGCTAITMDETSMSWASDNTTQSSVTYTIVDEECISFNSISVATGGTNGDKFTASINQNNRTITVAPIGENTTLDAYNGTVTLTYRVNGVFEDCTITFDVSQSGMTCNCDNLTMDVSPMSWDSDDTTFKTRNYTINNDNCIGNITAYTSGKYGNKFTVSIGGAICRNCITVAPIGQNTTLNTYNSTVTLLYYVNGASSCKTEFNVSQAGITCNCDDFSISEDEMRLDTCSGTSRTRTATLGLCNTISSVISSEPWLTPSVNGSTITVTASPNNGDAQRTATITVNFTANGSVCIPKTFTVIQPGCDDACNHITGLPNVINFDAS